MQAIHRLILGTALLAALVVAGSLPILAADIRTSVGKRQVVRTVSQVEPIEAAPPMVEESVDFDPWMGADGGCASGACTGNCDTLCQSCCLRNFGTWADFDFLIGWRHSTRFPPLVTTSPNGTAAANAGVLGQATTVIYPVEPIGTEGRPGGRISLGTWLDPMHCWGVEGRYFMIADQTTNFALASNGDPIVARPIFDTVGNAPAAVLLAFPAITSPGAITVIRESQVLGGDALLHRALYRGYRGEIDLLVGYQFARVDETLAINSLATDVDPGNLIPDGTTLTLTDTFATRNQYHAATIGAVAHFERGGWRLDVLGKIGLGNMQQSVTIQGLSVTDNPPLNTPDFVANQGLLAQGVNLGTFQQNVFAVSPELNLKAVRHVTNCVDVSAGYTFVYWDRVAQSGQQIDPNLNTPPLAYAIRDGEYWIHAVSFGVDVRF